MVLGPIKQLLLLGHIVAVLIIVWRDKVQPNIPIAGRRLLMVTAHPDDEAMFFGPTITYARENHASIYLLCLSSGNAEGLGAVRQGELINAAHILGIYPFNVTIVDDEKLPDSMKITWNVEDILPYIDEAVVKSQPDVIVTFDEQGVSDHTNHRQTSLAVQEYAQVNKKAAWLLNSVPLWRKYVGSLDVIPVIFRQGWRSLFFMNSFDGHFRVFTAMTSGHKSQMKWFRYIWLTLSRYNYVNDYRTLSFPRAAEQVAKGAQKVAETVAEAAQTVLETAASAASAAHEEL